LAFLFSNAAMFLQSTINEKKNNKKLVATPPTLKDLITNIIDEAWNHNAASKTLDTTTLYRNKSQEVLRKKDKDKDKDKSKE
jgi:hypothetical protein